MTSTPLLLAWSGGKDCLMALDRLLADPQWKVQGLLTTLDRTSDRVAMHDIRADVLRAQAAALGLPLIEMTIDWPAPNETYEAALASTLNQARSQLRGLTHIAFGDIFLADIRAWREASLDRLGWKAVFPLWNNPTRELAARFLARGHRAIVTTVDLEQLGGEFCGREFDHAFLADLPATVDPCGENGEFHTLCHASALFSAPLILEPGPNTTRCGRFLGMDFSLRLRLIAHPPASVVLPLSYISHCNHPDAWCHAQIIRKQRPPARGNADQVAQSSRHLSASI